MKAYLSMPSFMTD